MPGWRERSFFIARHGRLDFFHYDLYGQALASCLIEIASPKLERLGLIAPKNPAGPQEPELVLYRLLRQEDGDAFSRYQAFLRQLASFERALETRHRKQAKNAIACGGRLSISN